MTLGQKQQKRTRYYGNVMERVLEAAERGSHRNEADERSATGRFLSVYGPFPGPRLRGVASWELTHLRRAYTRRERGASVEPRGVSAQGSSRRSARSRAPSPERPRERLRMVPRQGAPASSSSDYPQAPRSRASELASELDRERGAPPPAAGSSAAPTTAWRPSIPPRGPASHSQTSRSADPDLPEQQWRWTGHGRWSWQQGYYY